MEDYYVCLRSARRFAPVAQNTKRLGTWMLRFLGRIASSVRKESISQSIPDDWFQVAVADSARICAAFRDVDVVIAMDETFIKYTLAPLCVAHWSTKIILPLLDRFHMADDTFIVPTGTKRVGTINNADDKKKGVTLVAACEMTSSRMVMPFTIDSAVFGGTLMAAWERYELRKVVFNETHWMTQRVFDMFMAWLQVLYKGQRIGTVRSCRAHRSNYTSDPFRI